jgi:hypothetical protein
MFHRILFFLVHIFLPGAALASTISVELKRPTTDSPKISPYIYGLGTYMGEAHDMENTWSLRPTYFRFGGNMAEVFNWKIDSWNTGSDWYFRNFKHNKSNIIDAFMGENAAQNIASAIVVPSMGWVAKDGTSGSFPVSKYGKQADGRDGFGNGISVDGKSRIKPLPERAYIKITPDWISNWVQHLKSRFGNMPHYYIIGNEPMLWHETHRDVHPAPATYDEVFAKYIATASAVRHADPTAIIIGPALWGWLPMQQSAFDERGPWKGYHKFADREQHQNKPFLQWFLETVVKEEQTRGIQLIDVVDVHYYPNNEKLRTLPESTSESRAARIAATRSLWDSTYVDDSWIKERIYLIPSLKQLTAKIKPSLRVAIGEYNFGAEHDISGGIAQAETLGIFAKEGLWSANYWTIPAPKSAAAQAFKLFRNYDGHGSSFASTLVSDSSFIRDDHSVFTSYNIELNYFTIILINKSQSDSKNFSFKVNTKRRVKQAVRIFQIDSNQLGELKERKLNFLGNFQITMPPLSVSLVEVKSLR